MSNSMKRGPFEDVLEHVEIGIFDDIGNGYVVGYVGWDLVRIYADKEGREWAPWAKLRDAIENNWDMDGSWISASAVEEFRKAIEGIER